MSRKRFQCLDCGVDTGKIYEHYFIHTDLWLSVVSSRTGMLCVGCVECRLGRELTYEDFPEVTINNPKYGPKSLRLLNRYVNNSNKPKISS